MQKVKKREYSILLPNTITYIGGGFGVMSIFLTGRGELEYFKLGAIFILVAACMDKLDGYFARKLDVASEFGKQLDSLCDTISFGVAPMFLLWSRSQGFLDGLLLVSIMFYIGCGIFRLVRFNLSIDDGSITGLPITIAGLFMAVKHIIDLGFRAENINLVLENIILITVLSFLMIGEFKLRKRRIH